jgi:hypothetical protein
MRLLLFPYHPLFKIFGAALLLFALAGTGYQLFTGTFDSMEIPARIAAIGLILIFFSRDKADDERVHQLKFRGLSLGVLYAYFLTFPFAYFSYEVSANEFVTISLLFAVAVFYYASRNTGA